MSRDYAAAVLLTGFGIALGVVAVIAWGAGGAGMMRTIMTGVLERRREVGVLRTVGWRQARVPEMAE